MNNFYIQFVIIIMSVACYSYLAYREWNRICDKIDKGYRDIKADQETLIRIMRDHVKAQEHFNKLIEKKTGRNRYTKRTTIKKQLK